MILPDPPATSKFRWFIVISRITAEPVPSSETRMAHSHTTPTRQPSPTRALVERSSRALLARNFSSQNCVRVLGSLNNGHDRCRCQKHPCTKSATPHLGSTMSGFPGKRGLWRVYRKPAAHNSFLSASSGCVFLAPIRDISSERRAALIRSTTVKIQQGSHFRASLYEMADLRASSMNALSVFPRWVSASPAFL